MACNCGQAKAKQQEWVFTSRDGSTTQVYPSEVQARARVIRDGGGRIQARVKT